MYSTNNFTIQSDAVRIAFFISTIIFSLILHIVALLIFNSA